MRQLIRSYQCFQISILRVKGFIIELFFETSFLLNIGQRTRYFWPNGLNLTTLLQVGGKLRQRHPGLQRAGHEAGAGEGWGVAEYTECLHSDLSFSSRALELLNSSIYKFIYNLYPLLWCVDLTGPFVERKMLKRIFRFVKAFQFIHKKYFH